MKQVDNPEVFLVAEPKINAEGMASYLREVGGDVWWDRVGMATNVFGGNVPPAEGLIEFMGRLCYRSWEPGLNKNVTKIREDRGDYLLNVLKSGHGSVLEHASFSFVVHNCSRVLTAELCRHRAGIAISEQSLRYVRLDDLPFRPPPNLSPESQQLMMTAVEKLENTIQKILDREGIDAGDDMGFAKKKEITSAVRRIAPLGLGTEIGWTANVRALRHVISMRSAKGAEEEIRIFADQVAKIMQNKCPLLFGDYHENHNVVGAVPSWETPHWKV